MNRSLDDKIDRLEVVGLGKVGLTKQLEDARIRIRELEREIDMFKIREQRLTRCKCPSCSKRFDALKVIDGVQQPMWVSLMACDVECF